VRVTAASIPQVLLVEPDVHRDTRGYFLETYQAEKYQTIGITDRFLQDNHSRSLRGTLRGLHIQVRRPQAKLIRVIEGEIYDVAVDVRRGSPTFGKWTAAVLSAENFLQCYIPVGFAHGFAVTSEIAQVEYKCSDFYDPDGEIGLLWNDPALAIAWPAGPQLLSDRDRRNRRLEELIDLLPLYP
jgi:dTDP-4-dehydrorhamnose 3,5-epimerase